MLRCTKAESSFRNAHKSCSGTLPDEVDAVHLGHKPVPAYLNFPIYPMRPTRPPHSPSAHIAGRSRTGSHKESS
jgi:hypothetical protein